MSRHELFLAEIALLVSRRSSERTWSESPVPRLACSRIDIPSGLGHGDVNGTYSQKIHRVEAAWILSGAMNV